MQHTGPGELGIDGGGRGVLARVRQAPDLAALTAMAVAGFAISVYLTTVHYAHAPLVCTAGGVVNCAQVTTSRYSVVPGTQLPITVPGMLWFLVSGGLALVAWWSQAHARAEQPHLREMHAAWGALGLLVVLYLVYAEIVRLHALCEWCTAIHVLTLLTFLVALYRLQRMPDMQARLPQGGRRGARVVDAGRAQPHSPTVGPATTRQGRQTNTAHREPAARRRAERT